MLWQHRSYLFYHAGNIERLQNRTYPYLCMGACIITEPIIHLDKHLQ